MLTVDANWRAFTAELLLVSSIGLNLQSFTRRMILSPSSLHELNGTKSKNLKINQNNYHYECPYELLLSRSATHWMYNWFDRYNKLQIWILYFCVNLAEILLCPNLITGNVYIYLSILKESLHFTQNQIQINDKTLIFVEDK